MLTLHDAKEIELRDYQTDAVEALRERIRHDQKRLILCAGTGAGKTVMASHLLRQADRKGSYALFLVDRVALVNQTSATLDSYGIRHGVLQGIHPRYSPWENVQVCSIQTLAKRRLPRDPALIVYDECFPGEVEVLTDEGFRRFDALTGAETFAQYDMETSAISFAPASRKVQRPSAGDVYRISADQRVDLTATGGHELIVESKVTGRKKVCVRDFRPGDKIMPVAGYACGPDDVMLAREQFLIAYQADGSMHHELAQEGATVAFTFSKERKINALLEIVERAGFEWREVRSQSNSSPNAQPRRRFMVTVPFVPHKRVWEYFNLSALSARKAAALLTEANRWDGHVQKSRDTNWTYTTTCKQTADFYQSLAVLAGMRATMSCVRDDRSATFSDCYRLHIVSDTDHIGCQRIVPEPVAFDGDVYCVTVPKGCIVVRQNGKVLIVGNCHAQYKATLAYMAQYPNAVKIGLTATPFTKGMGKHWDGMVNVIPTRKLIEEGHLIQPKMYVAKSPEESELGLTSFGEFSDESASSAGIRIVGDVVAEWVTKTHEFFNGPAKTIVFSPTVEHGRELCAAFNAAGFNFQQVSYLDRTDEERAAKIEEFRRPDSQIHGLVSCGVLTKGFDVPDCLIGISCKPYRKSLSSHMQEIGRVMRPAPGKDIALWLDHAGNLERFAVEMFDVWDNGAGELDKAEKRDVEKRERTEMTREKVVCPECSGALHGNICTGCGWEKPARSQITEEEGTLVEFAQNKLNLQPRAGLRADCLKDPRKVWIGALNYAMDSTSKGEQAARKWAAGIWYGIYPGQRLPFGWFDMPRQPATPDTYSLAEREVARFRKNTRKRSAA